MKTLLLEVRDRGTFIPVFAILLESTNDAQRYLLRRAGFGVGTFMVMVGRLSGGLAHYDIYEQANGSRTMKIAHDYIAANFAGLSDGDVVDVEFILGESVVKKVSERWED